MQIQGVDTIREVELELGRLSSILGDAGAKEILEMFLEDSPPRVETLAHALETRDVSRARAEAHSLKGSAGNLGAMTLWSVCEELEREIREGNLQAAREDLAELQGRLHAVLDHFTQGQAA
jgi:hypothetical protein